MPTYEYVCRSCDAHIDVVQRFDDASLTECASCGGSLRKVFGSIGIAFKGSGFYKNDSRSVAKSGNGAGSKSADGTKESVKGSDGGGSDSGGSGSGGSDGGGSKDGSGSSDSGATKTKEAASPAKESTASTSSSAKPSSGSSGSSSSTPSTKTA